MPLDVVDCQSITDTDRVQKVLDGLKVSEIIEIAARNVAGESYVGLARSVRKRHGGGWTASQDKMVARRLKAHVANFMGIRNTLAPEPRALCKDWIGVERDARGIADD